MIQVKVEFHIITIWQIIILPRIETDTYFRSDEDIHVHALAFKLDLSATIPDSILGSKQLQNS